MKLFCCRHFHAASAAQLLIGQTLSLACPQYIFTLPRAYSCSDEKLSQGTTSVLDKLMGKNRSGCTHIVPSAQNLHLASRE